MASRTGVQQRVLQHEVLDGVAAEAQLWEDRDRDALVVAAPGLGQHRLGVRCGVGDGDRQRAGGDAREPMGVGGGEIHGWILSLSLPEET